MNKEDKEMISCYDEQLERIKGINRELELDRRMIFDYAQRKRRENFFLIGLTVALIIYIATPIA